MSAVDIAKLYENLSLVDEDEVMLEISEEASIYGVEGVDRCLVGKVLSGKEVNREAFKGLIERIWSPFGQVDVELVGATCSCSILIIAKNRIEYGTEDHGTLETV
ncbi:hypothetical protein EZV62_024455 [Acer yangbiense]|uniref:Uncharacterized protein n=1 Tax=Acer yangbiense TaxID=1000413 RepID=A0A5C7GVB3_9ROSI|nr:hypothetical protein EZV62_024455 [Acer yangbiense]